MRRFALALLAVTLSAAPALAQDYRGSWACRDSQASQAGILTIYGSVYGFASTTYGDPASGTGTITGYTDGVGINDGPLREERGIEAARVVPHPDYGIAIQLETAEAIVMLCTPM